MKAEIEAKFLNIDKENIRKLLKSIGAELVNPERLMERAVFDSPSPNEYSVFAMKVIKLQCPSNISTNAASKA